eukprot:3130666-Rhodomonas_salina.1
MAEQHIAADGRVQDPDRDWMVRAHDRDPSLGQSHDRATSPSFQLPRADSRQPSANKMHPRAPSLSGVRPDRASSASGSYGQPEPETSGRQKEADTRDSPSAQLGWVSGSREDHNRDSAARQRIAD